MKVVKLWEYTIYEDGRVLGIYGKQIKPNVQIKVNWGVNKERKAISYARFIYYAFNRKTFNIHDKTIIIKQKDGNKNNYNINNLIEVKRKECYQGEKHIMAKLTDKQVEEIKNSYSNGSYENDSYRAIAKIYGVSHTMIAGIINGKFRNKNNYIL